MCQPEQWSIATSQSRPHRCSVPSALGRGSSWPTPLSARRPATPEQVCIFVEDIDNMGHPQVVVEGNNEPAMNALTHAHRVKDAWAHGTVVEGSPENELQANGLAERCVQTVKGFCMKRAGGAHRRTCTRRSTRLHKVGMARSVLAQPIPHQPRLEHTMKKSCQAPARSGGGRIRRARHVHDSGPEPSAPVFLGHLAGVGHTHSGVVCGDTRWGRSGMDIQAGRNAGEVERCGVVSGPRHHTTAEPPMGQRRRIRRHHGWATA